MKPVQQTVVNESTGNCLPACIASILEVPLDDVPSYFDGDGVWYVRYKNWLLERGYRFRVQAGQPDTDGYYIAQYPSSLFKGKTHVVVARNGEIAFDPNPRSTVAGNPMQYYSIESIK